MKYTKTFPIEFQGIASPDATVLGSHVRFTALTPRLLRLEYDPANCFEDRPSQAFWYRRQPVPQFDVRRENNHIEIETDYLILRYKIGEVGFAADTLAVTLKECAATWHFGQQDELNLLGTARTLDDVDGALNLEKGLLSRQGWAVYDDSDNLVFDDQGWLERRGGSGRAIDLYFFGFGREFEACLADFAAVAGSAPLLPRWALGNWWSRYWAYSAEDLLKLMDDFRAHDVPLSVCIVDMDWHITDTGNAASGWTGYTWNRDLFPDPSAFIEQLHRRGLKTALNLHPADGIFPHEQMYPDMAKRLGLDDQSQVPIAFNIADPAFTAAYLELLHHPKERDGIDFWWVDWQQGTISGLEGLDPLWWLNHLHFYDLGRDGRKRPFVFSRWGGLGNHRYPIGFSGDSHVTWESLAFQPYFTATAANVNYGWWSHDIGGHMGGIEDPELFARWVQFGVFSPIFRLHSTNNPFHERRPWGYDKHTAEVTSSAMRFRHAMIPYLYTMAWRNHWQHKPLVRPMYHAFPDEEPAYHCPDQYLFGSELVVAPFVSPAGKDTRMSRQIVWLPEGEWFSFFDALRYPGNGWFTLYGRLQDVPAFAKAGAIVPLCAGHGWSETGNPASLSIHLFPGADNEFNLYEDDGRSKSCQTPICQKWSAASWQVTIAAARGECDVLPLERSFEMLFRAATPEAVVTATIDGRPVDVTTAYDANTSTLTVTLPAKTANQELAVTVSAAGKSHQLPEDYRLVVGRRMVREFVINSWVKQRLHRELPDIIRQPQLLAGYDLDLTGEQLRALAEVMTGSGYHRGHVRGTQEEAIILWNNEASDVVTYRLVAKDLNNHPQSLSGPLPQFAVLLVGSDKLRFHSGRQIMDGQKTIDDWFATLAGRIAAGSESAVPAVLQFEILGAQDRSAFVTLTGGESANLTEGVAEIPDVTITAHASDWLAIINGQLGPEEAFLAGKLNVAGNLDLALQLAGSISFAPPNTYIVKRWRLELNYLQLLNVSLGSDVDQR